MLSTILRAVDFIHLMSYTFHGSWDSVTGHPSALYAGQDDVMSNARRLVVVSNRMHRYTERRLRSPDILFFHHGEMLHVGVKLAIFGKSRKRSRRAACAKSSASIPDRPISPKISPHY